MKTYETKQVEFDITKTLQKERAQGHTNSNNIKDLGEIINIPDVYVFEYVIY